MFDPWTPKLAQLLSEVGSKRFSRMARVQIFRHARDNVHRERSKKEVPAMVLDAIERQLLVQAGSISPIQPLPTHSIFRSDPFLVPLYSSAIASGARVFLAYLTLPITKLSDLSARLIGLEHPFSLPLCAQTAFAPDPSQKEVRVQVLLMGDEDSIKGAFDEATLTWEEFSP